MTIREITVVLNCQNQGRFLNTSVQSLRAAIGHAQSDAGVSVEWIIATDCPSRGTEEYLLYNLPPRSRKLVTNSGHLWGAANQAVQEAEGKFIAVVGGDDLVSANWLSKAYRQCQDRSDVVAHPAMIVSFGQQQCLYVTPDQENPDFRKEVLFERNLWPGVCFGPRKAFLDHPFVEAELARGYGHVQWHWVCDTVAEGTVHKPVAGTFSCCRQSQGHACVCPGPDRATLMPRSQLFSVLKPCEV